MVKGRLSSSARNALVSGLSMELDKHACYTVAESSHLTIALAESVIRQRYEELIHEVALRSEEARHHVAGVEGKVAFLTGTASGIGRATAQVLAQGGADVVVADINQAGAAETAQSVADYGRKALALPVRNGVGRRRTRRNPSATSPWQRRHPVQ